MIRHGPEFLNRKRSSFTFLLFRREKRLCSVSSEVVVSSIRVFSYTTVACRKQLLALMRMNRIEEPKGGRRVLLSLLVSSLGLGGAQA
jgi:hypothetical protein